jgi:hypothetical protein
MSTRDLPCGVKEAGEYGRQISHIKVPTVLKFWEPEPPEALGAFLSL